MMTLQDPINYYKNGAIMMEDMFHTIRNCNQIYSPNLTFIVMKML